jgi:hypothetical protein
MTSAPDLQPFTLTHGHDEFHARHVGLGHGDVFFLFLRAVSKAGLDVTLTLGPITIDFTPPDVTQPLTAVLDGNDLLVTWDDKVFLDSEQPTDVALTFSYRVGQEGRGFVTPWLETPEHVLIQCRLHGNASGCARHPLSLLYQHDSPPGGAFFFQLHVTNTAGHVTAVNTSSVRLPVRSPPDHALVMDVVETIATAVTMTTALSDLTSQDTTTAIDLSTGGTTLTANSSLSNTTPASPQTPTHTTSL